MGEERAVLGTDVVPVHYDAVITPNLKTFKYDGTVRIRLDVRKKTKTIRLNAGDKITARGAKVCHGKSEQKAKLEHDKKEGILAVNVPKAVKGIVELCIEFKGVNDDSLYGFCRTRYTYKGKNYYNLTTDCEPANAREVMPCFDEPGLKATFSFTLIVDKGLHALSNMPIKEERGAKKNKRMVVFETTPRMSTYLIYLGVGKYDISEGKYRNIKLRVLAAPGKKMLTLLPLLYLKKFLAFQEKYFGIRFALPKIDLIAVPDFSHGAMENWGAITFRETALLDNMKTATEGSKERIAEVIAHELAHQWFGNLVTMKWWDEIWLNESFADFLSNKTVDAVFPEWQSAKGYLLSTIGVALFADQLKSTHPIHVNVNTPEELGSVFDQISYEKGGSVLSMLESVVGKETFRKGLNIYLSRNKYGNAEGKALWGAMQEAAKKSGKKLPVSNLMEVWTEKPGYPVVEINKRNGSFALAQKRFTLLKEYNDGPWPIPLTHMSDKGYGSLFFDDTRGKVNADSSWIKLNCGQRGFYRVRYDEGLLRELGGKIKDGTLGDDDAWGIENDLFAFTRAGRYPLESFLDFISRYCMDCGYPVNSAIMEDLEWLNSIGYERPFVYKVRSITTTFNRKMLDRLGWDVGPKDGLVKIGLRNGAIVGLGECGDRETIARAEAMLADHFSGKKKLNPNIITPIYALAAMNGDQKLFSRFLDLYHHAPVPIDQIKGLQALAMFRDENLIRKELRLSLTDAIRLQDKVMFPMLLPSNPAARRILWEWQKRNWKTLMRIYGPSINMLDKNVDANGMMSDRESRDDFVSFFKRKENRRSDIGRAITQTTEHIDANIAFMERNAFESG